MFMFYEVLLVEGNLYYVSYYKCGCEYEPVKLKLNKEEFEKWKVGKVER